MAISSETSSATYAGNNSTSTAYSLAFPFSGSSELVVTHITSAGVRTTLAVTTGYTLHGDYAAGSGTLKTVAAIPVADTLLIERFTSAVQSLDSSSPAGSYPTSIETQLDRTIRAVQDNKRVAGRNFARSLRVPDGETAAELPTATLRKGEILYFNATTGAVETKTPNEILALSTGAPDGVGIPSGGTTGQALVKTSGTNYDAEWGDVTQTAAQLLALTDSLTETQEIAMREDIAAAANYAILRDSFARYANGTTFTHLAQDPEIGGDTNWRVTTGSGGVSGHPQVVDDATYGRGLIGITTGLYYMANTVPERIRSLTMELSLKRTGSSTGSKNGLTFGFGASTLVPSSSNIGLQLDMVHFSIGSSGIGNTITNAPSASFDELIPDGETVYTQNWFRGDAFSGLSPGRYSLKITFGTGYMTFAMAGRMWRWRDARLTTAAGGSFFFETAGPTGYDDVWIIHNIAVNDDCDTANMVETNDFPGHMGKSSVLAWPAQQKHEITGVAASFTKGNRPANYALALADVLYLEKSVAVRPWSSTDGEAYAVLGYSSANTANSPAGTDVNWDGINAPGNTITGAKLGNVGDWQIREYYLNFPNTNSKQFKFFTTGAVIAELTMPAFTDSGLGVLTVRQVRTSTVTNLIQLTLEVVTDATTGTTKKWIRVYEGADGTGNQGLRIKFTGTATGDAVSRGSTTQLFVKNT